MTTAIHITLAVLLFFSINWIGAHSRNFGYIQLSVFPKSDESPSFNLLYRVVTPSVFIIVVSFILYHINLEKYVQNIWIVTPLQAIFRATYNTLLGRFRLINWNSQILISFSATLFSYFVYSQILIDKSFFIPTKSDLVSEFWIIVLIYTYHIFNNLELPNKNTKKRKIQYIKNKLNKFKSRYNTIIETQTQNDNLIILVYSIMLLEDFNRPKLVRFVERIVHPKFSQTTGVMQVKHETVLSDEESLHQALEKIKKSYEKHKDKEQYHGHALWNIARDYNPCDNYAGEVMKIYRFIENEKLFH
ncbi:hypothetical protein [Maridesulfovibrio sp.]|uniref:hypothetical protein n=1 Tax=Maridesulfovibrio sp. TaxID=2795000 RepID=UPI0029C9B48E|nr:hypothetical protein [Maridesulfovibrio sp.]